VSYRAGDHVAVYALAKSEVVDSIIGGSGWA
jgi:hypothetical protein